MKLKQVVLTMTTSPYITISIVLFCYSSNRIGLIYVRSLVFMVRQMHDQITRYPFIGQNWYVFFKMLGTFYHIHRKPLQTAIK